MIRAALAGALLGVLWCGAASAEPIEPAVGPPGATAPAPVPPPAGSDATSAPGETLSSDDLRDVLSEGPSPRDASEGEPPTGTVRFGVYRDSDQTTVLRVLGVVAQSWAHWLVTGSFGVDAVTSASVDVRSSPGLSKVDVTTGASGRSSTSGGQMTDTRYQATGGAGWKDSYGHAVNATSAVAIETDYASISAGLNGAYDLRARTLTLLGGFTLTNNWISSVLDTTLHQTMFAGGWSAGAALVVTRDDALRVRYDGKVADGYQASPYRNVRFGDWTAVLGQQQITFSNTIGSVDGMPERVPDRRISHAAVLEWVHSLAPGLGLHPELRVTHDSWGIDALSAALDLRIARPTWKMLVGYRFYLQSRADFFEPKYTQAPTMYTFYTSDKELGDQTGHALRLDLSHVLIDADRAGDARMMFNLQLDAVHYVYPGFTLLPSRDSVFAMIGVSWEL